MSEKTKAQRGWVMFSKFYNKLWQKLFQNPSLLGFMKSTFFPLPHPGNVLFIFICLCSWVVLRKQDLLLFLEVLTTHSNHGFFWRQEPHLLLFSYSQWQPIPCSISHMQVSLTGSRLPAPRSQGYAYTNYSYFKISEQLEVFCSEESLSQDVCVRACPLVIQEALCKEGLEQRLSGGTMCDPVVKCMGSKVRQTWLWISGPRLLAVGFWQVVSPLWTSFPHP